MLPGLGRVSTSIPAGLTGVLGGSGRARRAVTDLFLLAGRTGPEGAIARWWAGDEAETLASAVRANLHEPSTVEPSAEKGRDVIRSKVAGLPSAS